MSKDLQRLYEGKLYQTDSKIKEMKTHAREIMYQLNQTHPSENKKREQLITELFGKVGKDVTVKVPFYCSHGTNIEVGDHCFINLDCIFLDLNKIILGNHVLIGPRVSIYTASHLIDPIVRQHDLEYALPVEIGNDVWIGCNVVINPGVKISNNVIIGSGSVVTKDIEDDVIVVGNPAKVLRKITQEDHDYWLQQENEYFEE